MQAWGATRTFEKHLMALAEGVVAAGSQDSGYEAAKLRARNVASGQAASSDTSKSVFDVCISFMLCCNGFHNVISSSCALPTHLYRGVKNIRKQALVLGFFCVH
jgi:hypothetical protein